MILLSSLRHRGMQVLLVVIFYLSFASFLPIEVHKAFYTVSLLIKDVLVWMMPVTVAMFIAYAICSFQKQAALFVLVILFFEALSNFSSVWYAFLTANMVSSALPAIQMPSIDQSFEALWRLPLVKPSFWSADKGAIMGLCLGCISAFSSNQTLKMVIERGKNFAEWILTKVFARLIPFFVLGFIVQIYQAEILTQLIVHYTVLLSWMVLFLAIYLGFVFLLGSKFSLLSTLDSVKNILPAGGLAFISGCSMSTMPWTIQGTAKNLKDPNLANAVIPATTNIQQVGDCIVNSFLCFLIYKHFYGVCPSLGMWIQFSFAFVLARFATSAILGGAIFVMLPVYETYLSFTPEMIMIILAFNVVLDPLVTACNVIGNGGLCQVFEKVWNRIHQKAFKTTD